MRRLSFLLLIIGALLSVIIPQLTAQDVRNPELQVIDSDPVSGQELGLSDPITLYFDRQIDCDSLIESFSISPPIDGSLTCDDGAITFTPSNSYERATTYAVRLDNTAQGADGSALVEPYEVSFDSQGFLRVSEVFPLSDGSREGWVAPDTTITIIFNRPVVPLVTSDDFDELPHPLTITPEIDGVGEWLNTSIYVFTPTENFAGGTTYTATVTGELEAVDGSILPEPFTWSFSTAPPQVISVDPSPNDSDVVLDRMIQLRFDQPMDRPSVESAFFMIRDHLASESETNDFTVSGTFEWADDDAGFSFTPDENMELDSLYIFGFNAPAYAKDSTADLVGARTWNFTTVPFPSITGTDPSDGSVGISPGSGFSIFFASPMVIDTLEDRIIISPEPETEPNFFYSDWSFRYSVSFRSLPSTTYTITVLPGMEDVYGNTIDEGITFTYTTDSYAPSLRLNVPGPIGFYSAYRAPTQLFLAHRNVSRVDLELYSVPVETFVLQLTSESYWDAVQTFNENSADLMRSWTIASNVPENALRYELLNLGEANNSEVVCAGSLPSRLAVGDRGIVITEPDPLRARSEPAVGEIVDLLYKDYALEVIGGPVCNDGIIWWEVELRDEVTAWVAESVDDEYLIDLLDAGEQTDVQLTTDTGDGRLIPGIYFLEATAPETNARDYDPLRHFMTVSTAVLNVKSTIDEVVVWTTDANTGEPVVGEQIDIYNDNAILVGSGFTDASGIARIDTPPIDDLYVDRVAVLNSEDHFGFGYSDWSGGLESYNLGVSSSYYPQQYRIYIYTDRPIYRPDQPVYFRGIVRSKDDVTYTPPNFETVPVTITDDRGEVIYEENLPLTDFGTFSDSFTLDPDASLGSYRISIELPSRHEYQRERGSVSFSVGEFRLPEFQVEAVPVEGEVVQGEMVEVEVDSTYFFGGSVSNADIRYTVVANSYFFRYQGDGYYDFYDDFSRSGGSAGFITDGEATTDETGKFVIQIPAELKNTTQSQTFTIEAGVTDESDQAVFGRAEVVVHQGLVYLGARAENYVSTAGEESKIRIISVDWDSNPVPNQVVDVEIIERRWMNVQEQDESGRTTWTWEVEEIEVEEGSVTTDENGVALYAFTPPNGGIFQIIITTRDENGNRVRSSTGMWVSSRSYVSWRQSNDFTIDLIADQEEYNVGDQAEILITSPFQGATEALISVERGGVLSVEHVTMDSNSYVYELEITPEHAPNIYVSVFLIKGVDENTPVVDYRMGAIALGVDISQKELHIEVSADRERAAPQETVEYTLEVTDFKGDPVVAEIGVGVTDLASLSILGPNSGPLLTYFYNTQGLAVRTSTPLTVNTDVLTNDLQEAKGGGGGVFDAGIVDIRGEFIDTPYWNPSVVTDENGIATIDVRLPDNLTTWRLDARALTDGRDGLTLVGETTFDLLSTRPLIVRPVTPRFFVVGDHVRVGAVVNNNTMGEQTVSVTLRSSGVTVNDDVSQIITIPADSRGRVTWDVVVEDVELVNLVFIADAGQYQDASVSPVSMDFDGNLPIYKYEVPETVGTAGVLRTEDARMESILLPRRFDVTQGELTINVDQSLASTTLDGLSYLRNYPHQCIEQTVSRFLPNIITFRALNELGLADVSLEAQLDNAVNFALQKLYAEQKTNGGWGWFVTDASNPLTTAYALIGLVEAQRQGFNISESVINRARSYLKGQLVTPDLEIASWRLDRQAFLLYALAYAGDADVARTVTLYSNRNRLSLYAQAFLAQTLNIIDPTETSRTDVIMSDILGQAVLSATGIHWDENGRDYYNWNTDVRTNAIILSTLIRLRPDSDLLPGVVRHLIVQRRADAWETTQETAWAVMALTDWMMASGELRPDYSYSVSLNSQTLTDGFATQATVSDRQTLVVEVEDLLKGEANNLLFDRSAGDGALYYTAHLRAFLPVPEVEALNRGIIIERRYNLLGDPDKVPITTAKVGDVVQVRLTIIAPNDLHYVVIEDPLPAGAEAINPNLETSQQIGTRPGLDTSNPLSRGWGWWWFSNIEFRDEKVVLYSTYLPAGTYEYVYAIRPGVEGTYNVIPATGQEFYFPEVYGRSAGSTFTIFPAD